MNTKEKEINRKEFETIFRDNKGIVKWNDQELRDEVWEWHKEQIRNAVANTEKQVMEKYNSIGRVVEESSKMQLDKWEAAIRKEAVAEREKEIVKGIMDQRISFVGKDLYLEGYHKAITNILKLMSKEILSKMGIALKGQKEGKK